MDCVLMTAQGDAASPPCCSELCRTRAGLCSVELLLPLSAGAQFLPLPVLRGAELPSSGFILLLGPGLWAALQKGKPGVGGRWGAAHG